MENVVEIILAVVGSIFTVLLGVVAFFLSRLVTKLDNNASTGEALRLEIVKLQGKLSVIDTVVAYLRDDVNEIKKRPARSKGNGAYAHAGDEEE